MIIVVAVFLHVSKIGQPIGHLRRRFEQSVAISLINETRASSSFLLAFRFRSLVRAASVLHSNI